MLALVLVCGVTGLEAWPFSGFRLFSQVRTPHVVSYRLATVDHAGTEHALPFRRLPAGCRGVNLDLDAAANGPAAAWTAVCRAMVDGARAARDDVSSVRVYAVERDLSHRVGRTSTATSRPAFTCTDGSDAHANG